MKQRLFVAASLLILISLVLLTVGLGGQPVIWQLGLAVLGVAMLLSLATRWARD